MREEYKVEYKVENGQLKIVKELYRGKPYIPGEDPIADDKHKMAEGIMQTIRSSNLNNLEGNFKGNFEFS